MLFLYLSLKLILWLRKIFKLELGSPKHKQACPIGFTQKNITKLPLKILEMLSDVSPKWMPFSNGSSP